MNFNGLIRATGILFLLSAFASAQQRPLITEDPRLIAEGMVVSELGFGYQHQARFPVSGLTGDLYSLLENGLHFGVGKRAEFQMTGVIHNYVTLEDGDTLNDWGDLCPQHEAQACG